MALSGHSFEQPRMRYRAKITFDTDARTGVRSRHDSGTGVPTLSLTSFSHLYSSRQNIMAETATQSQADLGSSDKAVIEELRAAYAAMREQLQLVIVGQDEVIEQLLISIFCRSHALLVGVPGLAKTLLISTLS